MYSLKSLYVGDLDSGVQEKDLEQVFSRFDGFATVRLCRDRISNCSLCYAYVNYHSHDQAARALRTMNHMDLKGKPMRIMWIKRDPYSRKTGVGNLYVKNLEQMVTAKELESVFSEYGLVLSCKIVYDKCSGRSRQFGFVQMCSDESAQKAIAALHDSNSTGLSKSLYVAKFVKKGHEKKNLYLKNLEGSITSKSLRDKFSEYGQVASAVVMEDEQGNSKGFGFVSFEKSEDAQSALAAMKGIVWGSRAIYIAFAQKKAEREALLKQQFAEKEKAQVEKIRTGRRQGYGVYVANLDESVRVEELKQLFESCGNVIFAKIVLDASGRSRGFGFVYLSTRRGAEHALSMSGMSILKSRPITVKKAYAKRAGCNKYAKSTVSSHAASGALVQPYSYQPYMETYRVQAMDQNKWAKYNSYTYGYGGGSAYSSQPAVVPLTYYDPRMQYIPATCGWRMGMGYSHRALSSASVPATNADSNSGNQGLNA